MNKEQLAVAEASAAYQLAAVASSSVPPGYKQTEVGVIPDNWAVKLIGDIASVGSGGTPSREITSYWSGTIPWVTTSQIDFNMITQADQFITEDGLKNSAAKLLPAGTLLMALYGQGKTRGKVGILGFEATTNQACASISLNGNISCEFLLHFLASRYESIRSSSNTGSQENLNGQIEITALEARRDKTRALKQGMMQELLSGRIRLL